MGSARTRQKKKAEAPAFDQTALAQLTARLDTSLPSKPSAEKEQKRKRPRDADEGRGSKKRQTGFQATSASQRDQDTEANGNSGSTANVLLNEILALGGDQEDYELVANLDSDNEGGQGSHDAKPFSGGQLGQSLQNELAEFASKLGFQQLATLEDANTDTDASEDTDGEVEDGAQPVHKDEGKNGGVGAPIASARQEKSTGKLIFEPRPDWHALDVSVSGTSLASQATHRFSSPIASLKVYAESLLDQDASNYASMQNSRSTKKFMSTIMSSGTLSDKISALTLSIQESPLHNQKPFETLINLAGKKSRGQAIAALGALVDLLGNGTVLPSDRRLRSFNNQPALVASLVQDGVESWKEGQALPGSLSKAQLVMWAYEDWLKSAFFRVIQLLEVWCSDEIEYSRSRALDFIFGLLRSKPEQEANLLRLLVNKLGDRERKIASRASYLILQLLDLHPGMKAVVIKAVEQEVLLKPGQSVRAKYYAVNTLNQTILSGKEPTIADTLLRIYFDMFLSLLKGGLLGGLGGPEPAEKSGKRRKHMSKSESHETLATVQEQEATQKLVSCLLTGVNRAIPFTASDDSTLEKHLDTLFRITHSSNFNTSVQALMLIEQLASTKHLAIERFYRTLYESLLDPRLITSSKQALYLNLLFRSMKNDVDSRRVKAFVKRLVQTLSLHQPSFACGILFLIAELEGSFPDLHALLDVPEEIEDDGQEVYKDVTGDNAAQPPTLSTTSRAAVYDGRKRDPEHSNAHRSCLWEIVPFLTHFHPSVSVFAANLLERQKTLPKPDLANHTLMHFLDKFVYRNPKATEAKRGSSIMQPVLASGSAAHVVVSSKAAARLQPAVNSASFWNKKLGDVSVEDTFFHEYFSRIGKPGESSKGKKTSDIAGSDDEEAEGEIWEALVNSRPDVEGGEDDDESDVDMEGYGDSDDDLDHDTLEDGAMSDAGSDASGGFEGIFGESDESDASESFDDEDEAESTAQGVGRKNRLSRSEMRSLPTFASVDDYADMLAGEEDGL